jgi:hypothetical protein
MLESFRVAEMGLGKTVEMCALILANKYTAGKSAAGRSVLVQGGGGVFTPTKATLVVVPVVLLEQWRDEIAKCAAGRLKVHCHHPAYSSVGVKGAFDNDLTHLQAADVVLTTYEVLRQEAPWRWRERMLLRLHWWRVVLDESQRVPRPTGASSSMTAIAKSCAELSRTHSWCMSGTPVDDTAASAGSIVDNLLGQLIFLGVEPYCSRGDNGDAFWEREISARWRAKDPDALDVVHDLLGQIMMRHSKAQCLRGGGDGAPTTALVPLPPKVEESVLLPLADPSERVVYGELERLCREDMEASLAVKAALARAIAEGQPAASITALRQLAEQYRREDLLTPRDLQLAATHVASLNLDATTGLERKLAARSLRTGLPPAVPSGALGGAILLRELLVVDSRAAARVQSILRDPSSHKCMICLRGFGPNAAAAAAAGSSAAAAPSAERLAPRISPCGHLFCTGCLVDAKRQRGDDACPTCALSGGGLVHATRLHTPLDASTVAATDEANGRATHSTLPKVEAAPWDAAELPPADKLCGLRVWRCDGAPCHDASMTTKGGGLAAAAAAQIGATSRASALKQQQTQQVAAQQAAASERMERSCTLDVDGLHFCSALCAEAKFKRALRRHCSVCGDRGHTNVATYWATEGPKQTPVEKYLHPLPSGGVVNVKRTALGALTGPKRPIADGLCHVSHEWPGPLLRGQEYASQSEAVAAFKEAIKADPSYPQGSRWQGDPLYPGLCGEDAGASSSANADEPRRRHDKALPLVSLFPPSAPAGAFLAHLDAAGAPRSYGKHWPYATGTKVDAALAEVARVRKASGDVEKVVVFSDSKEVLEVLHEAARRTRGDGAVASILGTTGYVCSLQPTRNYRSPPPCCNRR